MNPEIRTAKNVYLWLWFSPLLTIPTLVAIFLIIEPGYHLVCGGSYSRCAADLALLLDSVIAILGSALWHLVLLIPSLDKHSQFVRWHGRQALLLAGVRTAIPLAIALITFFVGGDIYLLMVSIPILVIVWLAGNLWGQTQAGEGECALMRWTGHGEGLPLPTRVAGKGISPVAPVSADLGEPAGDAATGQEVAVLLEVIRSSSDPEERRQALAQLEARGLVEKIGDEPEHIPVPPPPNAPPTTPPPAPPAEAREKAIPTPKKRINTRGCLFVAGAIVVVILLAILVVVDSSSCEPVLRVKNSEYFRKAGNCYSRQDDYEGAISALEKGLALDPQSVLLHRDLGEANFQKGEKLLRAHQYEQAIPYFDRAIELNPNNDEYYADRGWVYYSMEEFDRAAEDFDAALKLDPDNSVAHNNLAWTLAYHLDTDYKRALVHALRAVEIKNTCHNQDTLGLVYYRLGRYEESLLAYSQAIGLAPGRCVDSYLRRADTYLAMGNREFALANYQEYLRINPDATDRAAVEAIIETIK